MVASHLSCCNHMMQSIVKLVGGSKWKQISPAIKPVTWFHLFAVIQALSPFLLFDPKALSTWKLIFAILNATAK